MPASRAQQAKTAQRRRDAIAMRLAGADWDLIATKLGYASRGAACTDVTRAMEKAAAEAIRDADVLRQVELERINRLQLAYWPKAIAGDTDAAKVAQWCIDRRVKLTGLDAPIKHRHLHLGAIEAEIAELEAEMSARDLAALTGDDLDPAGLAPPLD